MTLRPLEAAVIYLIFMRESVFHSTLCMRVFVDMQQVWVCVSLYPRVCVPFAAVRV